MLRLQPGRGRAGGVRRIHALGDDALATELADLGKQSCAVTGEMIAEQNMPGRVLQELGQRSLAVEERARTQVQAITIEEVEAIEDQGAAPASERLVELR